jgi:type II secretory pathway component PulL
MKDVTPFKTKLKNTWDAVAKPYKQWLFWLPISFLCSLLVYLSLLEFIKAFQTR